MKRSCDSTYPCLSPTPNVNVGDLCRNVRNTVTSRPVTDDSQQRTSHHSSKRFTRNPVAFFLDVHKTRLDIFVVLPRFLEILLSGENLICSATVTACDLQTLQSMEKAEKSESL